MFNCFLFHLHMPVPVGNSYVAKLENIPSTVFTVYSYFVLNQGLTLRFQTRGPKSFFIGFLVIKHTILGPMSEKSRGPEQNLGRSNPG